MGLDQFDHTAAEATFVEITFGLNVAFAGFRSITRRFNKEVTKRVETDKEGVNLDELDPEELLDPGTVNHFNRVIQARRNEIDTLAEDHIDYQRNKIAPKARFFAAVAALACLVILYFDWLGDVGHFSVFLYLPILGYFIASLWNLFQFQRHEKKGSTKFKNWKETSRATSQEPQLAEADRVKIDKLNQKK